MNLWEILENVLFPHRNFLCLFNKTLIAKKLLNYSNESVIHFNIIFRMEGKGTRNREKISKLNNERFKLELF